MYRTVIFDFDGLCSSIATIIMAMQGIAHFEQYPPCQQSRVAASAPDLTQSF